MFNIKEFEVLLNPNQKELYREFIKESEIVKDSTAIGGRYSYVFTPTSLGISMIVEDSLTKRRIDLTDYDSW